jgi:uncharacterized protein with PIN domain
MTEPRLVFLDMRHCEACGLHIAVEYTAEQVNILRPIPTRFREDLAECPRCNAIDWSDVIPCGGRGREHDRA